MPTTIGGFTVAGSLLGAVIFFIIGWIISAIIIYVVTKLFEQKEGIGTASRTSSWARGSWRPSLPGLVG